MGEFTIEPVKPHIGGVVRVAREHIFDDEVIAACRAALEERGVLVFERAHLTDQEQLQFTDKLGRRAHFTKTMPNANVTDAPDVYKVTLDKKFNSQPEYVLGTYFWHIDGVTIDVPLPKATLLSARRIAAEGGETEFASTYVAYQQLPEAEKRALDGVKAVHSVEASMRPVFDELSPEQAQHYRSLGSRMVHPIVWTHQSGRKSLVIGTHADHVVDKPVPVGRAILSRLVEWAAQPDFTYRHKWQEGDFVIWDNCGTMHRALPYDENSGRTMHRTWIEGDERIA